jgi:hypothetical protein
MSFSIQAELRRINKLVDVLCENGARMHLGGCIAAFCEKFGANENDFWKSFGDANGQVLILRCQFSDLDEDRQIRLRVSAWDSESEEPEEPEVYDPDEHGQRFDYDSDC